MNIFHLHKDPKICAEYHCDKHVVKMILETAQMLSTAYRRNFGDNDDLYKTAYPKHPMTIWVEYKHKDYITAYKQYYIGEKKRFAKYTGVDTPNFMC
jgi:hypothetical protein